MTTWQTIIARVWIRVTGVLTQRGLITAFFIVGAVFATDTARIAAAAQQADLTLNARHFTRNDRLVATVSAQGESVIADIYFLIGVPGGAWLLVDSHAVLPLSDGNLRPRFESARIGPVDLTLIDIVLPAAIPAGSYTFAAVLVKPGTDPRDSQNWLTSVLAADATVLAPNDLVLFSNAGDSRIALQATDTGTNLYLGRKDAQGLPQAITEIIVKDSSEPTRAVRVQYDKAGRPAQVLIDPRLDPAVEFIWVSSTEVLAVITDDTGDKFVVPLAVETSPQPGFDTIPMPSVPLSTPSADAPDGPAVGELVVRDCGGQQSPPASLVTVRGYWATTGPDGRARTVADLVVTENPERPGELNFVVPRTTQRSIDTTLLCPALQFIGKELCEVGFGRVFKALRKACPEDAGDLCKDVAEALAEKLCENPVENVLSCENIQVVADSWREGATNIRMYLKVGLKGTSEQHVFEGTFPVPLAPSLGKKHVVFNYCNIDGTYEGSFNGIAIGVEDGEPYRENVSGPVRFSITNNLVWVTVPGRGAGRILQTGTTSFSTGGVGGADDTHCRWDGKFSAVAGSASGGGGWSCTWDEGHSSGTWRADRTQTP
jgi:hypothetical protein